MSVLDVTTNTSYGTLSDAITASGNNDIIQVSAGIYVDNFPNITHNLTIESLDGLAYLSTPSAVPVNSRAILNVPGDLDVSLTISGLALSGAIDGNNNGAGLLFESGNANLTVSNSWFYNNQDGLLVGGTDAADPGGMNITISNSEFDNNGVASSNPNYGYDHNLYVNTATQLTVTNSYLHDALGGHEIKSRALSSIIENNRIEDGPTATTSYSIDLAAGGSDVVSGNVIEKGQSSVNKYAVTFGTETTSAASSLVMEDNTLIDDRGGAVALLNATSDVSGKTIPATIDDNMLYHFGTGGLNQDYNGPPYDATSNNIFETGSTPALNTSAPFDFTACFAEGTRIVTARGMVAVEALRLGDLAVLAAGGTAPVIWLGHRRIDCRRHPRPHDVSPIRVRAGAFGPGRPAQDLRLSPDHAVHVDGVLIPIRYLLNGATIVQEPAQQIIYFHVELPEHRVILAEGLACESYLDTGNRVAFDNGGPVRILHPDFARSVWDCRACAELVLDGPRVAQVRQRLLALAGAIGCALTSDPALRVRAGGRTLALRTADGRSHVTLPSRTASVRFVSHRWTPAHTCPNAQDTRTLGVAIGGLQLDGRPVALDDARLSSGWHELEAGEDWRWTGGDAGLALAGVRNLSFTVVMTGTYWIPPANPAALRREAL